MCTEMRTKAEQVGGSDEGNKKGGLMASFMVSGLTTYC